MPNHVKNVLTFKKIKIKDIDFIINTIAIKAEDDSGYWIDFDKIIPQPKIESNCPDDCKVNKDSHITIDKDRPWFDWYKWNNKYWGTKWGAYDCYSIKGKSYIKFIFNTAWSMPLPIVKRLQLLDYEFELRYADEDYGANCGILSYEYDGMTGKKELYHDGQDSFKNAIQFAKRLWRKY